VIKLIIIVQQWNTAHKPAQATQNWSNTTA